MTVTSQDIIDNASEIAVLVNASDDVTIADLSEETSWADTDFAHIQKSGVDSKIKKSNMGLGGSIIYRFPAGAWDYPASNPAPLDTDSGTNGTIKRQLFDDTTPESNINIIKIPSTVAVDALLTVEFWGYPTTADGNEVQFRFSFSPVADGESWDQAFSDLDSGDKVTSGSQDVLKKFTFSDTLDNLGITPDELTRIKFTRIAIDDGTPVSGDWGNVYVEIRLS